MASNVPSAVEGSGTTEEPTVRFESIPIAPGKTKYMNPNFHKVHAKMYDWKCDIKLKVGNANFKAHREVLAEASDYFSAMFSHDMLEREQDVIELREISPPGFTVILDYFYHGHVTIDQNNIEDVLEAARFFHVEFLVEVCCDYLIHELGMENFQNVLILADKYWLGDLRTDIFNFFGSNIMKMSEQKNFFDNLDADLLMQFLKEDIFVDAPEDFLLFLIRKWVHRRPEERQELMLPLLRLIRYPLIDIETLETLPSAVTQFPEIQDLVEEGKYYNINIAAQCLMQDKRFTARGAHPNVIMFSVSEMPSESTEGRLNLVYRSLTLQEPHTCCEELLSTELSTDFCYASIVTVGDFLYSIGGYDEKVCSSNRVFRYSARTREWIELASMHQARVSHVTCTSRDRIFAIGGVDHQVGDAGEHEHILSSAEMYDVVENSWVPLPDLVHGLYDHAAAFSNNNVYVTGGISSEPFESIPTNSGFRLNLESELWEPIRGMLHARQGHSMSALNNRLFVLGGYTSNLPGVSGFKDCTNNEMYDIETNQWTEIIPTPSTFGHLLRSVAVFNNMIFVLGNGHLGFYHTEEDRFQCLEYYGLFVHKLAVMNVAYPLHAY